MWEYTLDSLGFSSVENVVLSCNENKSIRMNVDAVFKHTVDLSFLFQDFFVAATGTRATITEVFLGINIESDS